MSLMSYEHFQTKKTSKIRFVVAVHWLLFLPRSFIKTLFCQVNHGGLVICWLAFLTVLYPQSQ